MIKKWLIPIIVINPYYIIVIHTIHSDYSGKVKRCKKWLIRNNHGMHYRITLWCHENQTAMAGKNPMFSPVPRRKVATLQFGDSKIHIVVPNDS